MRNFTFIKVCISTLSLLAIGQSVFIALNWKKLMAPSPSSQAKASAPQKKSSKAPSSEGEKLATVRGAVSAKMTFLQACYETYLAKEPTVINGSIRVSWHIDPMGQVGSVSILDSEFQDSELDECLLSQVRSWSFAPFPDEEPIAVAHKFTFRQRSPSSLDFESSQ